MPICPECKSKNPHSNKFCQSCGASLIERFDRDISADVALETDNCESCDTLDCSVLWAIVTPSERSKQLIASQTSKDIQQPEAIKLADFFHHSPHKTTNLERYVFASEGEVCEQMTAKNAQDIYVRGKVIDRQPQKQSHLATLRQQQGKIFEDLRSNLDNSYLSNPQFCNAVSVPTEALPYLILERYIPAIPKIFEAWQGSDGGVTLIEDRSELPLLTEFWSQEELPLAQILWLLGEMAKLWLPLRKIGCSRSLLIESNIRVDEDGAVCLQQLFLDKPDDTPSLKNLAQRWQTWSNRLSENYRQDLERIFDRVISGEIQDLEQLRLQLRELNPELDEDNFFNYDEISDSSFEDQLTVNYSMQLASVVDASCTNIGSQRSRNEDFFAVETSAVKRENNTEKNLTVRGLYVVCDGMGGHDAGEVASQMAVKSLLSYFQTHWLDELPDRATIEAGILAANNAIYQANLDNCRSGTHRMGTTLAMALLQNCQLAIAHVGDSRIYHISRKHGLQRLTTDHEVGQREIRKGVEPEIAYGRPDAYQLTQALGPRNSKQIVPEIDFVEITEDCLILLCSDGLCDRDLIENHWQEYLEPLISSNSDLEAGLFELIEFADRHNGHDNITGISIRIKLKSEF